MSLGVSLFFNFGAVANYFFPLRLLPAAFLDAESRLYNDFFPNFLLPIYAARPSGLYTFDFPPFLFRSRKDFNSARLVGFRLVDFLVVVRFFLVARIPFFAMPVSLDESTSFKLRKVQRVRHPTVGRGAPLDRITDHTGNN